MELKTDEGKRKQYLRPRRALFLGVTLGVPALSILLTAVLPREWYYGTPLGYILGTGIFSCIFSLIGLGLYYADCSGTYKVQKLYLYPDKLVYSGYSGQGSRQIQFYSVIDSIDSFSLGKWKIRLNGRFLFTYTGRWDERKIKKNLSIIRTLDNEQALLALVYRLQVAGKENVPCSR